MPRLSIATNSTPDWSLDRLLDFCADDARVEGVGVWQKRLKDTSASAVRKRMDDAGLSCSSLYFAGGFTQGVDAAMDKVSPLLDQAQTLGAPQILYLPGPRLDGQDLQTATRLAREGLERTAEAAAERGIRVGVEPLHPIMAGKYGFACTWDQTLSLMDGIPNTHLCLDTWNSWWEVGIEDKLADSASEITWIHVCDWKGGTSANPMNRATPGDGIIDFESLLSPILSAGFDNWIEFELMQDKAKPLYTSETYADALTRGLDHMESILGNRETHAIAAE